MDYKKITVFQELASIPSLEAAFDKVIRNGGGAGGDGETISEFARQSAIRIARLSHELEAGYYRPGPLRRFGIPKRSGGQRMLAIPCIVDRVAQSSAATVLSERLEPHFENVSFGYRPGRSVQQAVARVASLRGQGYGFIVDGDIRSFFDEVPHGPLLSKLGAILPEPRLTALVGLWLEGFSNTGRGLAQGSPLSPLLSNLYLDAIDEAFLEGPVRIVRFADDFVLLARTAKNADKALARISRLLTEHGLELNADKTRIVPLDQAFSFLGRLFIRSMVFDDNRSETEFRMPLSAANLGAEEGEDDAIILMPEPAPPAVVDGPILIKMPPVEPEDPLQDLRLDRSPDDFATGLAPLYVLERGRRLEAEHDAFRVTDGSGRLAMLPARLVGRIDLGPEVEADDGALRLAAAHRIPVAFLDGRGQPQALLTPPEGSDAGLHLAQARLMLDETRALDMARALVSARLRNAHALLKRLNRRRKLELVETACTRLFFARRRAEMAASIDMARGFEGEGARSYWTGLGACLEQGFVLRARREEGGANPVNAVLDFTAHLLTRDVRAATLRAGLHPGFGVLHTTDARREACVYDLVEAFRAPMAEGLTVYLFNNRIIGAEGHAEDGTGLRLSSVAARRVVEGYEKWAARPVRNPRTGLSTTWRGLFLFEAYAFASALRNDTAFLPFAMDY